MTTKKSLLIYSLMLLLPLTSCGGPSASSQAASSSEESSVQEPTKEVSVFVLSGQSNMEGSTLFDNGQDWLRKAMNARELDPEPCFNGMDGIQTSFYGYYPYDWQITKSGGEPTPHCSNPEDPMAGKFLPTKVGMGNKDEYMGPEIGMAYTLKDHKKNDNPIFFIKCAFSGSGFASQTPNWTPRSMGGDQTGLYNKLYTYTNNNLNLIKSMGYEPVIKGFLWHQGESDSNSRDQTSAYYDKMTALLSDFRSDFAAYARGEDGNNINFIDCLIFDGPSTPYGDVDNLNDVKLSIAALSDKNFCINGSMKRDGGLQLEIGGAQGDVEGGVDIYHYKTRDMFRLGEAYANIILDNGMLD